MKQKIFSIIIIIMILLFTAALRVHTFYLPHNHGDQIFYLGLAMKMDQSGLKNYNLKGIDVVSNGDLLSIINSKDKQKGGLLESLEQDYVFHYSIDKLYYLPPAFSSLLMVSHKLFNPANSRYQVVDRNLGPFALIYRPDSFFKSQFYAVWINFIFSLLFVLVVFILGKALFNEKAALWAAFLIAVCPLDILTSQRLWVDEMLSFFISLCVLLFWYARKKNNIYLFILSGVSAGIAALTKQSGFFVIVVVVLAELLIRVVKYYKYDIFSLEWSLDRNIIIFVLTALLVSSIWYIRVTLTYGKPWYMPHPEGVANLSSWSRLLSQRFRYGQLYYFVYLLPLFIFFYIEFIKTIVKKLFIPERIICMVWFLVFMGIFVGISRTEERYILPAYPAIAIFSGVALEEFRVKMNTFKRMRYLGDVVIILLLVLSAIWAINLGLKYVFNNAAIFNLI